MKFMEGESVRFSFKKTWYTEKRIWGFFKMYFCVYILHYVLKLSGVLFSSYFLYLIVNGTLFSKKFAILFHIYRIPVSKKKYYLTPWVCSSSFYNNCEIPLEKKNLLPLKQWFQVTWGCVFRWVIYLCSIVPLSISFVTVSRTL